MKKMMLRLFAVSEAVSLLFLATLGLSVIIQIVMRNVFSSGSVILEEFARFSLVCIVFLMIPVLVSRQAHILVDFFIMNAPAKLKGIASLFSRVCQSICTLFLLYAVWMVLQRNGGVRTPAMRMPNYIFYIPLTFGLFLTLGALVTGIQASPRKDDV